MTTLPPAAEAAFDAARVLVVELLDDPRSAQVFAATSQLPPGTDLRAQAGDAVFERVAARLAERYGLPPEASARLQPWAAYLTLSQPAGRAGEILDAALQRRARARARPVVPLETVEAQLATLAAVRPAHMLALLDALARRHDEAMAAIDELIARYRAEDLAGLLALETQAADDEPALRPAIDDLLAQLLQRRNATMAERLAPLLARDASFVAVGALHLLGPDGLPARPGACRLAGAPRGRGALRPVRRRAGQRVPAGGRSPRTKPSRWGMRTAGSVRASSTASSATMPLANSR